MNKPNLVHLVMIAAPFRVGVEDMTRPPSALLYVGGFLKRHGFEVQVHHIREMELEKTVEVIVSGPRPLFVGFSVITGQPVASSARMSRLIKRAKPDWIIVWGGIHPSLLPEETLNLGSVDFVVVGEGEHTALDLAQSLREGSSNFQGIGGLAFLESGRPVINPPRPFEKDLDKFQQDWSLVDIKKYIRKESGRSGFCFITSRGCPHNCGFCYNQKFNHRRWRAHSLDFVIRELLNIKKETGISFVTFDDDNFFSNPKRGLEILRRLREQGLECDWLELRVDYITEDFIRRLVELGVKNIFVGWESGSDHTLGQISKGFNRGLILEKTKILAKFPKLVIDASAIVGFPWESEPEIQKTITCALEMFRLKPFRLNFNLGLYVPYPGSPIVGEALTRGFRFPAEPEGWRSFDILSGAMKLPWLSQDKVRKYTLVDNYAKLLYVRPGIGFWRGIIKYSMALAAFLRLKTGFLAWPWEAWLVNRRLSRLLRKALVQS
ncbi:MAG: radical SAM protein [Thermodesulfobacteriota bacterium]